MTIKDGASEIGQEQMDKKEVQGEQAQKGVDEAQALGMVDTSKLTTKDMTVIVKRFLAYMRPFLGSFIFGCFMALLYGAAAGAQPYFIKILMDDVLKKQDFGPLKWLMGLIVLSAVLKGVFMYAQGYLLSFAGQSAVRRLREEVYGHLQSLPISFFERWQAGQIMHRVITDINLMTDTFTNSIMVVIGDVAVFAFAIGMMIYLDWRMTLVAFLASPAIALVMQNFGGLIQKQVSKMQNRISDLNSIMQENINGIKVIKAFGAEQFEKKRFADINEQAFSAVMKSIQFKLTQTPLVEIFGTVGLLVILGFGAYLVNVGKFTTGDMMAFVAYMLIATSPVNRFSGIYAEIRKGMVSAARVFELIDVREETEDAPGAVEVDSVKGLVEFDNVRFSYDERNPILRGISFTARQGEMIAIVGPNGAGKTTLVNLIPRFYPLTDGSIRIDGRDIREIKVSSLRKHIGVVLQETILFSGTIKENIAYADPSVPDAKIVDAAKAANAHEFILDLPDGYKTRVGEGGVGLSGGQRQRISIARTLLRHPEILILDEATSSLDQKSEALLQEALERLLKDRTTFVIAHRLSTITKANRILVLDRGQIVQQGAHEELMKTEGIYRRLYEAQKTLEEEGGTITGEQAEKTAECA